MNPNADPSVPSLPDDSGISFTRTALYPAAILALAYTAFSALYIVSSTFLVEMLADDVHHFANIEMIKGLVFVLASSFLLFFLSYKSLAGLIRKETLLYRKRMELNEAENRSTAGLFASSVAHDINNILMITKQAVDTLSELDMPPDASANIVSLNNANGHLEKLAKRLSHASGRHLSSGRRPMDAAETVRDALTLARTHNKVRRCVLETSLPDTLPVLADSLSLHRLVLNLIINAAEAVSSARTDGYILIEMTADDREIRIAVHDNGPGIPIEKRAQVFEPFFSTKGSGTGLGLLSARHFAELHGGVYGVEESKLGGACVFVSFPMPPPRKA